VVVLDEFLPNPREEAIEAPPSPPSAPRPLRLAAIRSYAALDAYEQADALKGKVIRVAGEAEVRRTSRGVHAIFWHPKARGRRISTVAVKNDDAGPLAEIKVDEAVKMRVNLETVVRGVSEAS